MSAFIRCSSLTSINIPTDIKCLDYWLFCDCSGLKSVTIPEKVETIESDAFYDCESLTAICACPLTPPATQKDAFNDDSVPPYVPAGTLAAYQSADVWKDFTTIKEFDATGMEGVSSDSMNDMQQMQLYNLNGQRVTAPTGKGLYIRNGKTVVYQ